MTTQTPAEPTRRSLRRSRLINDVIVGGLILGLVAVPVWINRQERQRDCESRQASGVKIERALLESVKHAEDTDDLMVTIRNATNEAEPSPFIETLRAAIDEYSGEVGRFRRAAEEFKPVEC